VRARDARMPPSDGDCTVVQDTENVLSYWFEDVGAQIAIVRPDRYVAALCRADALGGIGEALLALAPAERTAMPA
jgi:hypothetical protein